MGKKRLVSGVKPTGRPHVGNYFGAMRQFVELQELGTYDPYVFVADYHGLNFIQSGPEMRQNIIDLTKDYLAIGLDPEKTTLFKQSDISEHTELAWIFDTITTMPYLMRSHAYKAAVEKAAGGMQLSPSAVAQGFRVGEDINVGTFNYPMLMAADILLYDADVVPVGQDQKQHVEYTRDTAEKFNRIFGQAFKLPEHLILETVSVVPGTDGKKMSKSYGNTIPLFATKDEIIKAVMGIVTDSSGDIPTNVYAIHKLYKTEAELSPLYAEHKGKYKALKQALIEDIESFVAPMRERRESLSDSDVKKVLHEGGEKAKAIASAKMADVRQKIGVAL